MRVHIDFETRSTVDIWESGAWTYSAHPSTEVLCIAYAIDNGPVQVVSKEEVFAISELRRFAERPDIIFTAHNAFFEQAVWHNIMVKKYKYPEIPIARWICTSSKACAFALPKALSKAASAFGLTQNKDNDGRAIMFKLCKPRKPKKNEDPNKVYWHESPEDLQTLYKYCAQDVEVERELDNRLPDLMPQEQEVWIADQVINARGVQSDQQFVNKAIDILKQHTDNLNTELSYITGGAVTAGTQVGGMLKYLNDKGVVMTSLDKQSVSDAIKSGTLTKECLRVLRLRQELGKASTAKYSRMVSAGDEHGVIRDNFVYHSASTGRWGGKAVQLQNLPKGLGEDTDKVIDLILRADYNTLRMCYSGNLIDNISSCIRGCFVPRKGNELYVVDYAAIEARVVFWLAGETQGINDFYLNDAGKDVDIYVKMARRIYADEFITKANKAERQLGKQAILGCGYGMGGKKFGITCEGYGIHISEYDAERIVTLYRDTYPTVRKLWWDTEAAAMQAVRTPGVVIPCGKVSWLYNPEWDYLFCKLPSGRKLCYANPQLRAGKFDRECLSYRTEVTSQWVRRDTFGGHLTENISQATARDIMAYAIVALEIVGFKTVMHTHDEIVCDMPKGANRLKEMEDIMCKKLWWSEGLPLKAEGFITERYRKG